MLGKNFSRMSKYKAHTNLKVAVYVTIVTAIVFLFLFVYIGINTRKYTYEDSKLLAKEVSRKAAGETEIYLTSALMVARSIEQKVQVIKQGNLGRNAVIEVMKSSLIRNPNFLATWTMWEPNAFDGKDKQYIGDTLYDINGTMAIAFFKYKDKMLYEKNDPNDFNENFYAIPKKSRSELLLDPFYYQYHGHPYIFYETSVVVPVIYDSIFYGVFGIDLSLDNLQNDLNSVKLYKTGYLSLISNSGIIVTHPDSSIAGKDIFSYLSKSDTLVFNTIKQGKELSIETKSEFTGLKVFRFFYPIKVGNGSTPWSMMVEIPIKEATTRSQQLTIVAYATLFIGISLLIYLLINISDRRRYEYSLIESKRKAEESNNLKTAFLNNISHEIRTPLNGIVGFAEMITYNNLTKEQIHSYNEIIRSSCNQLLSIISNVLELSKIQTGQIITNISKVSIDQTIDVISKTFALAAEEKGLEIKISNHLQSNDNIIFTDENKLHQVLSNLLGNAVKFTNSGSIEIGVKRINASIQFYVKDTGIGISSEKSNSLFQIFTQGDNTLNREYGGSGIGLSISKAFVEILGGRIWFESEVEKGTTFYFTLPNNKPVTITEPIIKSKIDEPAVKYVLVVEDEKYNFILIQEILKDAGVNLLWASSGEEAIQLCKENSSISLVLMDIRMPGLNGYEATKIIKSFRQKLPIIAVTAYVQNQDSSNEVHFDSIIAKPFRKDELFNALKKYF